MKVIPVDDVEADLETEPPLDIRTIDQESIGSEEGFVLGRTIIPPAGRNQQHSHKENELIFYLAKGKVKMYIGQDKDEYVVEEGSFVFIPKEEPHGIENLSDEDEVELIYTYSGSSSRGETWKTTRDVEKKG